jgi:cysteine desulfurase/selenocysteine lyase
MEFDIQKIRADFPILTRTVNNKSLVYFDNGATTQKPIQVIECIINYYSNLNSNVHRGVHRLSQDATNVFEQARKNIAKFINAKSEKEIIFTKGTTESINLMSTVLSDLIQKNDEILITAMEHHSNLVPWQQLCKEKEAYLKIIPVNQNGEIEMSLFEKMLNSNVKLVAFAHISNVLGTINPVKEMTRKAHDHGIPVLIDGAQAIAHLKIDVQDLNCEFYCFSAHKAYGPMGIGVLYGKESWLNELKPYHYGGEMIKTVCFEESTFTTLPYKYEAGTPNVEGVLAMETALNYIEEIGIENIRAHEDAVLSYATEKLMEIEGMRIIGTAKEKTAVLSFVVEGIHPYDIGTLLDQMGVAVRTGNHCAQPLIDQFEIPGTVRASFALYNTIEEVDYFVKALKKTITMLT